MTPNSTPIETVYMFPGLGAEYPAMLETFCAHYPWAGALVEEWGNLVGCDLTAEDPVSPRQRENLRQLRIHALNLLWWRVARPAASGQFACCGHSLGFYAALSAAGALTEHASLRWVQAFFDAAWDEFADNPGKIAVITTTAPVDPHRLASQFSVEVMAKNSARQVVVYGAAADIAKLCLSLKSILVRNSDLGTPIPFHSINMWRVCDRMAKTAASPDFALAEPTQPVWSHLTGEPLATAAEIRATLLEQPCRTVLWEKLMHNLWNAQPTEFVEVGPSRILSQLLRWNEPAAPVRPVDTLRRAAPAAEVAS
ncbi:MAG: ACP S-malonyltransferase [Candidatus Methylumidiphilus sp.]